MNLQLNTLFKGLATTSFILLVVGIFASWNTPANGYEISIFSETPMIYWVALIFSITTVFLILLAELLGKTIPKYLRIIKWVLLAVCIFSFTMLFAIRGFYGLNFNGDTGTHIGNLKILDANGSIFSIYPSLYYFTEALHHLTSLDIVYLTNIIPGIFNLIFIIGIFVATHEIFKNTKIATISTLIACALPFGTVNDFTGSLPLSDYIPYVQGLLAITPFIIYIVYSILNDRNHKKIFVFLGSLLLLSLIFYHILAAAILLLILLSICVGLILQQISTKNRGNDIHKKICSLLIIIGTTVLGWITWTIYLNYLGIPLASIKRLLLGTASGYSREATNTLTTGIYYKLSYIIDYVAKQFGLIAITLFILILTLIIIYVYYRKWRKYQNILLLYAPLFPLTALIGFSFVSSISFQPGRIVMCFTILGIILSGFVLLHLINIIVELKKIPNNNKTVSQSTKLHRILKRVLCTILITIIILPSFILGIQMYYPGASVNTVLADNPKIDVYQMQFYFKNGDGSYSFREMTGQTPILPSRYFNLIYGGDYSPISNLQSPVFSNTIQGLTYENIMSNKFNYKFSNSISDLFKNRGYLFIGQGAIACQSLYHERRFDENNPFWIENDFEHLNYDNNANLLYNNGDMLYLVG